MRFEYFAGVAACAALLSSSAHAATLVGPTDAWFGIDNLEITYSGGTELFNVRFDQRSFNDVYGSGTPDLPFTTEADVESALTAIGDFLNDPFIVASQLTTIVPVAGGEVLDDGFIFPISMTTDTISNPGSINFNGPVGWRYLARSLDIDRTEDLVQAGLFDVAWAVFTPVPAPAGSIVIAIGAGALCRRRR